MAYAEKVRSMQLHKVWDCLVAKAVRKGRAEDEVYAVARWLLGYAKEDIEAPIMHDVRVLDKMVDELAHGKPLAKVLRAS